MKGNWLQRLAGTGMVLALVALAASAAEAPQQARAFMTGDQQLPPIETLALGYALFTPNADLTKVHYRVVVGNMRDVTASHIHAGRATEDGPPVVNLFTGPAKEGRFEGVLAEGDFTAADMMGLMQGKTLKDLWNMARDQRLYVNVHTDAHPEGEIRGQMLLVPRPAPPRPAPNPGGGGY